MSALSGIANWLIDQHQARLVWGLLTPVAMLLLIGLASIHATERHNAGGVERSAALPPPSMLERLRDTIGPSTLKQLAFTAGGIALLVALATPSYQKLGRYAYPFYGLVMVLLGLLVLDRYIDLPLIPVKRATRRWIELGGMTIQPSEFMKLALVVALARYLRFRKSYRTWAGLVPPFLLTLAPMVLILKQPDLGTLLMLLPVLLAMLFLAGARLAHLATIVLAGVALLPLFYFFGMHDYQRQRVEVLLRQNAGDATWQRNEGYQLHQSKLALGSGGLLGEGYGEGAFIRYELLPEGHNDFIFAVIGNQWGLAGGAVVILAYVLIVILGTEIATTTNDPFGRLLAIGVVVMIVAQALLNICMTVGLAPTTGMPLPFASAGGSSLWANFMALGLLVNVARRRAMLIANPPFEHEEE